MSRVFVYTYTSDGKTFDLKRYVMNRQQALEIASCTQKLASALVCSLSRLAIENKK